MLKRTLWSLCFLALLVMLQPQRVEATVISPGAPTITVPTYLSDGSYPYAFPNLPTTLASDQFLLPVDISGAAGLQSWQFDLSFDNTVVQEVDPFDGTSGIYGARFTPGDPNSLSFILGGFPFNGLGLVDDVAGSYPSLPNGPSGNGTLAYILFEYLPGQENNDPGFSVGNATVQQAPEPTTLALLAIGLLAFGARRKTALAWRIAT